MISRRTDQRLRSVRAVYEAHLRARRLVLEPRPGNIARLPVKLSKYFDFPGMRAILTRRMIEQHASGNEYDTHQAQLAFLAARYIEWFRGDNA